MSSASANVGAIVCTALLFFGAGLTGWISACVLAALLFVCGAMAFPIKMTLMAAGVFIIATIVGRLTRVALEKIIEWAERPDSANEEIARLKSKIKIQKIRKK